MSETTKIFDLVNKSNSAGDLIHLHVITEVGAITNFYTILNPILASTVAPYLPLTAGSGKPLTDDLYFAAGKSIHITSGTGTDYYNAWLYAVSTGAEMVIQENTESGGTQYTFFFKSAVNGVSLSGGTILTDKVMGVANGVATLDSGAKIPASQLPSYVDDVVNLLTITTAPSSPSQGDMYYNSSTKKIMMYSGSAWATVGDPESGKIYICIADSKTYRWSGTAMAEISASLALGETSSTAYAGNKGKANADAITALQASVTALTNNVSSNYLTKALAASTYMPLAGGNFTDDVTFSAGKGVTVTNTSGTTTRSMKYYVNSSAQCVVAVTEATPDGGGTTLFVFPYITSGTYTIATATDVTVAKTAAIAHTDALFNDTTDSTVGGVTVNQYGLVKSLKREIIVGSSTDSTQITTDLNNLAVGGLYFELVA